jgi:hypothetical protein
MLAGTLFRREVNVYRCFLTDSYTVVGTPQLGFRGLINRCELRLNDEGRGSHFEIEVESRLMQAGRSHYLNRETLWNVMPYSGDTFFDYVTKIPNFKSQWGGKASQLDIGPRYPQNMGWYSGGFPF